MATEHWFSSKLREVPEDECRRLLHAREVGRLAFCDDSGPDVLPVNYVMDGDDVLIATSPYGAIARSGGGARVAFEVDELDDYTESGWSVVVRGRASRESPFETTEERPHPWADGNRSYVMRIHTDAISGRRLIPT